MLIANNVNLYKYLNRWCGTDDRVDIDMETYKVCFKELYVITNVTKLRDFQYRLLLGKVFTGELLYNWNVIDSPLCYFCQEENETVVHLFMECKFIQEIWNTIKNILEDLDIVFQ